MLQKAQRRPLNNAMMVAEAEGVVTDLILSIHFVEN
jgi:hypothetical protein